MNRASALLLGVLLAITAGSWGATGGFPSRPTFQQVNIGGAPTVTVSQWLTGNSPNIFFNEADQAANARAWGLTANAQTFLVNRCPDSLSGCTNELTLDRATDTATVPNLIVSGSATVGGSQVLTRIACSTACNAAAITVGQQAVVRPSATATRTSTVTNSADADLQFTSVPVGNYSVTFAFLTQGSAGGSRFNTSITGGSGVFDLLGTQNCGGIGITATAFGTFQGDVTCATSTSTYLVGGGILRVTGSASTVAVSWSQNASNATPTTRTTDSYIVLTRLN